MSLQYIRSTYLVPARRGSLVQFIKSPRKYGKITGSKGEHLLIKFLGSDLISLVHPLDLNYDVKIPTKIRKLEIFYKPNCKKDIIYIVSYLSNGRRSGSVVFNLLGERFEHRVFSDLRNAINFANKLSLKTGLPFAGVFYD